MPQAKIIRTNEGIITVIVRRGYLEEKLQGYHHDLKTGDTIQVKRIPNNPYLVLDDQGDGLCSE